MSVIKIFNPPTKAGIHSMQIQLEKPISLSEAKKRLQEGSKPPSKVGPWVVGMFYEPDGDGTEKSLSNLKLATIANDCEVKGSAPDACVREKGLSFRVGDYGVVTDKSTGMAKAFVAYTSLNEDIALPQGTTAIKEAHFDTKAGRITALVNQDNQRIALASSDGVGAAIVTAAAVIGAVGTILGALWYAGLFAGVAYIVYKAIVGTKKVIDAIFGKGKKSTTAAVVIVATLALLLMRWWRRPAVGVLP